MKKMVLLKRVYRNNLKNRFFWQGSSNPMTKFEFIRRFNAKTLSRQDAKKIEIKFRTIHETLCVLAT